jgi:hypothetical protein
MWSVVAALASIAFGAIGWGIANLLVEPMKAIVDLRREVMECMIVYGDLPPEAPAEQRKLAGETFRRIGAGLVSRHYSAYSWVRWFYTRSSIAWDIHSAGERLIRIGNGIQFSQLSRPNNLAEMPLIRQSLGLPDPEPSPLDRELMAHAARPAPIRSGDLGA